MAISNLMGVPKTPTKRCGGSSNIATRVHSGPDYRSRAGENEAPVVHSSRLRRSIGPSDSTGTSLRICTVMASRVLSAAKAAPDALPSIGWNGTKSQSRLMRSAWSRHGEVTAQPGGRRNDLPCDLDHRPAMST